MKTVIVYILVDIDQRKRDREIVHSPIPFLNYDSGDGFTHSST